MTIMRRKLPPSFRRKLTIAAVCAMLVAIAVIVVVPFAVKGGIGDDIDNDNNTNDTIGPPLPPTTTGTTGSTPTVAPSNPQQDYDILTTTFYAIADVPYTNTQRDVLLPQHVRDLPSDAEFLVHLGDLKSRFWPCTLDYYLDIRDILLTSPVPVFLVVGDNEYNDCDDATQALRDWRTAFSGLHREWIHPFTISNLQGRNETFSFVHKRTLWIGLNLPGGRSIPENWSQLLTDQVLWTLDLIDTYTQSNEPDADGVVIFGHTTGKAEHTLFFDNLATYVENDMGRKVPMVYLNGDTQLWTYEPGFLGHGNVLRMGLTRGLKEPPLKVLANPAKHTNDTQLAFQVDRLWT